MALLTEYRDPHTNCIFWAVRVHEVRKLLKDGREQNLPRFTGRRFRVNREQAALGGLHLLCTGMLEAKAREVRNELHPTVPAPRKPNPFRLVAANEGP